MTNFLAKNKYWIFLWIVFFILRFPSLFEPYWYGDEGIYLTLGQGIKKGLILYQQIHDNKPPTLYYLAALAKTVFGFRFLLSLLMVLTSLIFYRLSQKFFSDKISKIILFLFIILTCLPFLEGNIANAEIFMLLPTIFGFLTLFNGKKNFNLYLSGLFLGLAFTIKIPVAVEAISIIFYLLVVNLNQIKTHFLNFINKPFYFGIGFLTPTFIYLIYFYFLHALVPFLSSALLQNFSYVSSWTTGNQSSSVGSGGVIQRFIILLILWFVFAFLYHKKLINKKFFLVIIWFFACIFGSLLSTRPYPHYLIQIIPPFCLLVGYIFNGKIFNLYKIFTFLSFIFLIIIVLKYNFYFYKNLPYYQNFYTYLFNFSSTTTYRNYFGSNVDSVYQIANYIQQKTNNQDKIFIWGDEPYIYALSNRLPSGKYTVAYHIVDFNGYDETINSLETNLPKFIVYFPMENRSFSQLDDILNRYYFLDKKIQSASVFQKR